MTQKDINKLIETAQATIRTQYDINWDTFQEILKADKDKTQKGLDLYFLGFALGYKQAQADISLKERKGTSKKE